MLLDNWPLDSKINTISFIAFNEVFLIEPATDANYYTLYFLDLHLY